MKKKKNRKEKHLLIEISGGDTTVELNGPQKEDTGRYHKAGMTFRAEGPASVVREQYAKASPKYWKSVGQNRKAATKEVHDFVSYRAKSNTSRKEDIYNRTDTRVDGDVRHHHDGSVDLNVRGRVCGTYNCCSGTQTVYTVGGRVYYNCPYRGTVYIRPGTVAWNNIVWRS